MNPLGDDSGILIVFGLCVPIVLVAAYRVRGARHPIAAGTVLGMACGLGLYAVAALIVLAFRGTSGYHVVPWLILVGAGLVPAAALGLVEGFVAGLIFRLLA